jgi:hypothetical protein
MTKIDRRFLPAAALAFFWTGCAAPPPVFPPPDPSILWPRTGDRARYSWLGKIEGEADLKRPRSFWSRLTGLVAGRAPEAKILSPYEVVEAPGDILFVSDPDLHAVHRFDLASREYRALGDAGEGRSFDSPIGLALSDKRLIVADRGLKTVTVLSLAGDPEGVLGAGELEGPVGVAVGPLSGLIYVVDVPAHQVKVLDGKGSRVAAFGGRGTGKGLFNYPTHVACDAAENVYVTDSMNSRIQVFDRQGMFLREWGRRGDSPGEFAQPKGIAVDGAGRAYVVDSRFENIQVFDAAGSLLLAIGEEGSGPGQFWLPVGVSVAGDRIWVGDAFNHRVQVFRFLGDEPVEVQP